MASPHISVNRQPIVAEELDGVGQAFRVQIATEDAQLIPPEIFLHRRVVRHRPTDRTADELCGIADPYEIAIYPIDDPDPEQVPGFFRKSTIDVYVATAEQAEELWQSVQESVAALLDSYRQMASLYEQDPVNLTAD